MVKGSGGSAVKPAIDARTAAASLFPPIRPRLGQALCALLFAVVVSSPGHAHENVSGEPPVHPEITPAQAAFDKMFWDIDEGEFPLDSRAQTFATLARLEQAIPPGDVHRQLQYRYMHCLIGFNHDAVGAVEYARAGAEAALAAGDEASEAALRACMGIHLSNNGDAAAAAVQYEQAAQLARRGRDFNVEGIALVRRGNLRMDAGDIAAGLQDLLDAQQVFERGQVAFQVDFNLFSIAQAYRRLGELDRALDYINRVVEFGQARSDELVLASALNERGRIRMARGEFEQADTDLRQALVYATNEGRPGSIGYIRLQLAELQNRRARPREALDELQAALSAYRQTGGPPPQDLIDLQTGIAQSRLGQHRLALQSLGRALPALHDAGDLGGVMEVHLLRADSREALGDATGALADLREFARLRRESTGQATHQRVLAMSEGFDARYTELRHTRLREQQARAERLAAAERQRKPWRIASIALGAVLALVLAWLVLRQARRALRLRRMASTDPLTGAINRREVQQRVAGHLAGGDAPLCVVLIDLDHFKQVNDRFGHAAGDQVLMRAVAAWNTVLRADERLARLGGEEFVAVLPGAGIEGGAQVAQRLLEATRAIDLADVAPGLSITASFGVAAALPGDRSLEDLLGRADAALYRAKAGGRDRIEIAGAMAPEAAT